MASTNKTKLKKNANTLNQLYDIVTKQAEAQQSIVGTPNADLKAKSPDTDADHIDKNKVKPENNTNEFKQEPSKEEAGKVVSAGGVKAASNFEKLSTELLDLLKKADAQESVKGEVKDDLKPSSPEDSTDHIDKNKVVPEDNTNKMVQEKSKEEAGKVVSAEGAKTAEELSKMASKIATYNIGINLVRDLIKESGYLSGPTNDERSLMKEAGSRDFELLINEAASALRKESSTAPTPEKKTEEVTKVASAPDVELEKQAAEQYEAAGAAMFRDLHKEASILAVAEENKELSTKVAALEAYLTKQAEAEEAKEKLAKEASEKKARLEEISAIVKQATESLAPTVAASVIAQLKSESTSSK